MSDETRLPPSVGRLDDVVEAIREGDRLKAGKLLQDEFSRLYNKVASIDADLEKAMKMKSEVRDFMHEAMFYDDKWIEARKACGWSGVDGFEGPVEGFSREFLLKHADAEDEIQGGLTAGCQPALKAEELPIGTVMVLGGKRWKLEEIVNREVWDFRNEGDFPVEFQLWATELQELINRGVRFEISKGGA